MRAHCCSNAEVMTDFFGGFLLADPSAFAFTGFTTEAFFGFGALAALVFFAKVAGFSAAAAGFFDGFAAGLLRVEADLVVVREVGMVNLDA